MTRKGMGFIDQKRTSFEKFDLHEAAEPNLYRNISTYREACKIEFDQKEKGHHYTATNVVDRLSEAIKWAEEF